MWDRRAHYLDLADVALRDTSMEIKCGQCGKVRGAVNHWFVSWVERTTRFCFDSFDNESHLLREEGINAKALCGEGCVAKAAAKHAEMMRISQ